jgi:Helix-turn-helix domain
MERSDATLLEAVRVHGGIAPRVRCRSRLALTLGEREEISRGLCAHRSIRQIARDLGRSPSTVSREIARNSAQWWRYRAHVSGQRGMAVGSCVTGAFPWKLTLPLSPEDSYWRNTRVPFAYGRPPFLVIGRRVTILRRLWMH